MSTRFSLKHTAWVLGLLGATVAQAQTAPPSPPPAGAHPGMMMHHPDSDQMRARWLEHRAKREAELKAKLQLTAAQEPAWAAFVEAIKPPSRESMMGGNAPKREEFEKLTTPERIDKMRAMRDQMRANRTAMLTRREEATKTFYAALNADQRKVFDTETYKLFQRPMHGPDGHHGGPQGPRGGMMQGRGMGGMGGGMGGTGG